MIQRGILSCWSAALIVSLGAANFVVAQQPTPASAPVQRVAGITPLPNTTSEYSTSPLPQTQSQTASPLGSESMADRLKAAEQQIEELRDEMARNRSQYGMRSLEEPSGVKASPTGFDANGMNEEAARLAAERANAEHKKEELLAEAPKMPIIKLGGFFHLDSGWYSQDANSIATYGDMQDGTGFRRARVQAYGSVTEFTNYIIEMDYGIAGRPSFADVWVEQTNLGWLGSVRIGQFRQPTTMDALTSIRHLDFLERNASFQAMDPFRKVGIMAYNNSEDERTTWAYSAYRTGFTFFNPNTNLDNYGTIGDTRYGAFIGDNGGWSGAIRATHLLYYDEPAEGRYLLHVGGGYNYSQIGGNGGPPGVTNGGFYIGRAIPEFFVGSPEAGGAVQGGTPFIANTGIVPAQSFDFYHAELAGQWGAAHFQTEYLATALNTDTQGTVLLDGAYFQCGYFLTGENAGYNKQFGVMDYNVTPFSDFFGLGRHKCICGWGAWEVAWRWSYLDLSRIDATPATPPANAGTSGNNANPGILNESTLALNWYWNKYTRVQFNWINADYNSNFYGRSNTDIYALRFQVEF